MSRAKELPAWYHRVRALEEAAEEVGEDLDEDVFDEDVFDEDLSDPEPDSDADYAAISAIMIPTAGVHHQTHQTTIWTKMICRRGHMMAQTLMITTASNIYAKTGRGN